MAVAVPLPLQRRVAARSVSVVLVAYNSGAALLRCLASIDHDEEGVDEIVIVNNGVCGIELDIAAQSPRVKLINSAENVGFGAGCNLGAANASGDVIVFLNPDTVAAPGAIAELVTTLEDDSIAIAMARLRLLHEPELLNSSGNVVHISGLGWAGDFGERADRLRDVLDVTTPSGAAMAMRADEFRELGGFRGELFLYHEDAELGWRVHMQGRRVVLNSRADIYHDFEHDRHERKCYYVERNRLAFVLLDFSARTLVVLAPVLVAAEAAMFVLALKQGWALDKIRGWGWCLRNLRTLLRYRRETQSSRTISDRELVRLLEPRIQPRMIPVPKLVQSIVNPLLDAYWRLALRAI